MATNIKGLTGTAVGTSDTQTLTNKTLDGDNNTVSNLAHGAEVDNPSSGVHGVTGSVVGTSDSQTLTNKTLTSPVLNTGVSGTAILDEDNMASDSATQLATQQSIKAYVDARVLTDYRLSGVTVYTANNTWTKPAGLTAVVVEVVGGGGGGGAAATTTAGQGSVGTGGGGGGYARKLIAAGSLGATEAVTVGGGGAGGVGPGAAGSAGSTTSFGAHCSATGGSGGNYSTASNAAKSIAGATGGTGSSGDINISGTSSDSVVHSTGDTFLVWSSKGGDSQLGKGGEATASIGGAVAGVAGKNYGGGGSGSSNGVTGATGLSGGAGAAGCVIVWEYK